MLVNVDGKHISKSQKGSESMLVLKEMRGGKVEKPVEKLVEGVLPVEVAKKVSPGLVWQTDMTKTMGFVGKRSLGGEPLLLMRIGTCSDLVRDENSAHRCRYRAIVSLTYQSMFDVALAPPCVGANRTHKT